MNDNSVYTENKSGNAVSIVALVFSVVAMILAGCALWIALTGGPGSAEPGDVSGDASADGSGSSSVSQSASASVSQSVSGSVSQSGDTSADGGEYITFNGYKIPVIEKLPVNTYDAANFSKSDGRVIYTKDRVQALTGIDVSSYQGDIDWAAVKNSGVEFVMIRVGLRGYTKGGIAADSKFEQNITGALNVGLKVGVYFFSQATTKEEAQAEADYVLDAIKDYKVTFPVVFDWERITESGSRTKDVDGYTLTACADAFCDKVRQAGYTPAVYFNQSLGYMDYYLSELGDDVVFWMAEYASTPSFYYHFDLWQYSNSGTVSGISGKVDMNLCFTDFSKEND